MIINTEVYCTPMHKTVCSLSVTCKGNPHILLEVAVFKWINNDRIGKEKCYKKLSQLTGYRHKTMLGWDCTWFWKYGLDVTGG